MIYEKGFKNAVLTYHTQEIKSSNIILSKDR